MFTTENSMFKSLASWCVKQPADGSHSLLIMCRFPDPTCGCFTLHCAWSPYIRDGRLISILFPRVSLKSVYSPLNRVLHFHSKPPVTCQCVTERQTHQYCARTVDCKAMGVFFSVWQETVEEDCVTLYENVMSQKFNVFNFLLFIHWFYTNFITICSIVDDSNVTVNLSLFEQGQFIQNYG